MKSPNFRREKTIEIEGETVKIVCRLVTRQANLQGFRFNSGAKIGKKIYPILTDSFINVVSMPAAMKIAIYRTAKEIKRINS